MNPDDQQRRDEPADVEPHTDDPSPVDGAPRQAMAAGETSPDGWHDNTDGSAYALSDPPRSVVTMSRFAFIAMVTAGVVAILALGAATAWLALDRGGNGDDPVVATVNGEEIRRTEYDRAVAENNGESVLEGLIVERLIASEAKKRNIVIDQAETARQINDLRQQLGGDQAFRSALQQQGLTEQSLVRQYELSAMLREMVADQVQVTDQEVDAQYQASTDQFAGVSEADAKDEIRAGLQRQKENAAARDLLDQLHSEARIETNIPGKPQS
jgi:hypothetical protein